MNEKVKYWVDIADYDYETAIAMYNTGRWLYVGFMCHQVVEKMIKAYHVAKFAHQSEYTHNLSRLARQSGLLKLMSGAQISFLDQIQPLNIEARYPEHKQLLIRRLTPQYCKELIENTKAFKQWI